MVPSRETHPFRSNLGRDPSPPFPHRSREGTPPPTPQPPQQYNTNSLHILQSERIFSVNPPTSKTLAETVGTEVLDALDAKERKRQEVISSPFPPPPTHNTPQHLHSLTHSLTPYNRFYSSWLTQRGATWEIWMWRQQYLLRPYETGPSFLRKKSSLSLPTLKSSWKYIPTSLMYVLCCCVVCCGGVVLCCVACCVGLCCANKSFFY